MQCGDSGWCVILQWLAEHGAAKELIEGLAPLVKGDEHAVSLAYERAKTGASIAVTLLSGSFAVWKWYTFRESVLHERLSEYILENNHRLEPARNAVVDLIQRPDRRTNLRQPAFALELAGVLRRWSWEPKLRHATGGNIPDRQFDKIAADIDKRLKIAEDAALSLKKQRAAANVIAASLASARSSRARDSATARRYSEEALRLFVGADDKDVDLVAIEGRAFQLLRLEQYLQSYSEYEALFDKTSTIENERDRALLQSRAQLYMGLIAFTASLAGTNAGWMHLQPGGDMTALGLRAKYENSFRKWDLIEHAEANYTVAFVANRRGFKKLETARLEIAKRAYERVLAPLPSYRPLLLASERRLQSAAREGLARVNRAQTKGEYDLAFLHQPAPKVALRGSAQNLQQPAETVSRASRDDSVADADQKGPVDER